MFSSIKISIVAILTFTLLHCVWAENRISDQDPGIDKFAFDLLKQIVQNSNDNFNFAPVNLSMSLALAANGATGETQKEMLTMLGYENNDPVIMNSYYKALMKTMEKPINNIELSLSHSIWYAEDLTMREEFRRINSVYFNSDLRSIDLKDPLAPDHINRWVYEQTNRKIFSLVDEISQDVIMYMLSTFYFKGSWAVKFNRDYSKIMQFKARNEEAKDLVFMKTKSDKIAYLEDKGFKAIGLPYGKGEITMYFFLPDEDSHIDLFLKSINPSNWQKWMNSIQKQEVVAVVPRIEFDSELTFNEILQELGMKKAFSDQAQFGSLCSGGPLISEIKQKTFLSITEEGTEVAAADKVVFKKGGCPHIYLTRPFVYALLDERTGEILLLGVYQK